MEDQLITTIAGWAGGLIVTSLVGVNAFFIAGLVKKLEAASQAVLKLGTIVETLAHNVEDQGEKVDKISEKFSEVHLEVAILKREADANKRRRGSNGSFLEDSDG